MGGHWKPSDAHPPARRDWGPTGRWEGVGRLPTLTLSFTHSLTNCRVDLIDVTLASEDTNSKLVEVVTVADVDDEDHVGNSLWGKILKLEFG